MKPPLIDLLKFGMADSYYSILHLQKLIDEWDDPKDIASRAAVMIQKTHKNYGRLLYTIFGILEPKHNCKHPKKMRDLCADGTIYCLACNGDLNEEEIMSAKTSTLIKDKVVSRRKSVKK